MKLDDICKLCDEAPKDLGAIYLYRHSFDPFADPGFRFVAASRTLLPKLLAVAEAAKGFVDEDPHLAGSYGIDRALAALESDA